MTAARLSILAVEPWLGGSHRQFLEQWRARSRHSVEILGLPARHWRWRMRSAAWELARELEHHARPDVVFASDYLDLASFLGQVPAQWGHPPAVVYFHENQITYPLPEPNAEAVRERDRHLAFTNVLSAVRADRCVFNSEFHRLDFERGAIELCKMLPRPNPRTELEEAIERAVVVAPGIDTEEIPLGPGAEHDRPLRVVFNQRWEYDKDPVGFLTAIREARAEGAAIELVLLGESFEDLLEGVPALLAELEPAIVQRGHAPDRADYARALGTCDVVVSTSRHEFFGMAVAEALAAGCAPLLPDRLAYPELAAGREGALYSSHEELVNALRRIALKPETTRDPANRTRYRELVLRHDASAVARDLDAVCDAFAPVRGNRDGG